MDKLELSLSKKVKLEPQVVSLLPSFLQGMVNRLTFGVIRYGSLPMKEHKYFTRLKMEAKAYQKSGNAEHLFNIANYALLENTYPEHKNYHKKVAVESATRGRMEEDHAETVILGGRETCYCGKRGCHNWTTKCKPN